MYTIISGMKHDHLAEHVRAAGFRVTRDRLALLRHLESAKAPQSIREIAQALRRTTDQVTVYRIVDAFTKAGLIRELDLRQGKPLYELADPHDHHHVVCTSCGKVGEFTGCDVARLVPKALKQVRGFSRIESHALELFGVCTACAR